MQPFENEKWTVTTVKEGADAPCRSGLPLHPPPPPGCPASPPQDEMECSVCFDQTSQHYTCACGSVPPHVICWPCMDKVIEFQCTNEVTHFFRNRGIACPCGAVTSSWRLPFEDVKRKLSAASVQYVTKAERALIADDAFKAAMQACPPKDHVASTLEWLLEPEKCPQCCLAIEVGGDVSFCVHKRSHGDAAHWRVHSNALSPMQSNILLVLSHNVCGFKKC